MSDPNDFPWEARDSPTAHPQVTVQLAAEHDAYLLTAHYPTGRARTVSFSGPLVHSLAQMLPVLRPDVFFDEMPITELLTKLVELFPADYGLLDVNESDISDRDELS